MSSKFFEVVKVSSGNQHLPTPLQIGEVVMKINDEQYEQPGFMSQFMKIYHNEGKNVSSFHRSNFAPYKPSDKTELVKLLKQKGKLPKEK